MLLANASQDSHESRHRIIPVEYAIIPEVLAILGAVYRKTGRRFAGTGINESSIAINLLASSRPGLYTILLHNKNCQRKEHAGPL
jgi:hypothetical protein